MYFNAFNVPKSQTNILYTQRHKLRTAYSTNDWRGKWVAISLIFISIYLALVT